MSRRSLTPEEQQKQQERLRQKAMGKLFGREGWDAANAFTTSYLKPGFLGRVDTMSDPNSANAKEIADIKGRYQRGLDGYTSQEYQAQREQMQRGLNSNLQTNLSSLARSQARGKVYGAAASAQQANALQAAQMSKDNLEQDLMIKNIDEKQNRLGAYSEEMAKLREEQLGREKINLGQANAETSAQISTLMGLGGLGLSKSQQAAMRKLYERGLAAAS